MFDLGIQELIVIFIVALLVFGPKRLPELGKTLGKGILELKKAMEGIREQMKEESEALKPLEDSREPEDKKTASPPVSDSAYADQPGAETGPGKETQEGSAAGDSAHAVTPEPRKEDKADGG